MLDATNFGTSAADAAKADLEQVLLDHAIKSQRHAWEDNPELIERAKTGQKPNAGIVISDGSGVAPATVFNYIPGQVFSCTTSFVRPLATQKQSNSNLFQLSSFFKKTTSASSPFAALQFACSHPDWGKDVLILGADNTVILKVITGEILGKESGYSKEWLDFVAPIAAFVKQTAIDLSIAEDDYDGRRLLAGLKLTQMKLQAVDEFLETEVPNHERNVVAAFASSARNTLYRMRKDTTDADIMSIFLGKVEGLKLPEGLATKMQCTNHQALGCGCCDSRANPYDVFGGGIRYSNSIAVLIPKFGPDSKDHPTWANITSSVEQGIKHIFILGHSNCGGVKALVDMMSPNFARRFINSIARRLSGKGKFVTEWLKQGAGVVQEVLDYEKQKNLSLTDEQRYMLAAFRIKIQSGRNAAEYAEPKGADVSVYFLEIDSRNIIDLPLNQTMEESLAWVLNPEKRKYLLYTPPEVLEGYAEAKPKHPAANDDTRQWVLSA